MAFKPSLTLCLLVSSVFANLIQNRSPSVLLPMAVKISATGGTQALINRDRARARALFAHGQAKAKGQNLGDVPIPVTDAVQSYTASVCVGAGTYTLLVDTGSSNTWVGAGKPYQPGPNSKDTGETVSVNLSGANFSGEEFIDDVKLGGATIISQSIGVASSSTGLGGLDGILGVGPADLTKGTTSGDDIIPTVTDNLFSQGTIDANLLGVSLAPMTSLNDQNGEIVFGATDGSKFTGSISFVPITKTPPANQFWGINQSITYGSSGTRILSTTAGIVDTGTALILLATDGFQAYQKATRATLDKTTGLLTVPNESNLESMFFDNGDSSFELTANAQMWPRAFNSLIGGNPGQIYLIVNDLGTPSGQGLDFINGFTFLQRFYSVYDTDNSRVGLSVTSHTFDTTN